MHPWHDVELGPDVPRLFHAVISGATRMIDQNAEDDKIIAVHADGPEYTHDRDISELPEHELITLKRFFEDHKALESKEVRVERFMGRVEPCNIIEKSIALDAQKWDRLNPHGREA